MTSLDAGALEADAASLDVLRLILGTSVEPVRPAGAFDPEASRMGWSIVTPSDGNRLSSLVSETMREVA